MESRTKEEIIEEYEAKSEMGYALSNGLLLEVLVDIRDELCGIKMRLDELRRYKG